MYKYFLIYVLLLCANTTFANEVQLLNNQELKQLMQRGVAVIDVRSATEWRETGVVESSHLIRFYDEQGKYDLNTWLAEVDKIANTDDPVILICHSGGRSKQLANYLRKKAGYKEVYNVKRGIAYWIKQNNPVVAPN